MPRSGPRRGRESGGGRRGSSPVGRPKADRFSVCWCRLIDWNKRNVFCTACSRPLRSVWAGWKRTCIPAEPAAGGAEIEACSSKKGVHNFNYPRTDPVCIMGRRGLHLALPCIESDS